jgi:hypothetical protein
LAWGGIALYAAFVLASPVLHHDFACHQTTPTHCPWCVASLGGSDLPSTSMTAATHLIDAGATPGILIARTRSAQIDVTSGRAPPVPSL